MWIFQIRNIIITYNIFILIQIDWYIYIEYIIDAFNAHLKIYFKFSKFTDFNLEIYCKFLS